MIKIPLDNHVVKAGAIDSVYDVFDYVINNPSFIGSIYQEGNSWYNTISVRHRNGGRDGNLYGMMLYSKLTSTASLYYRQHISGTWGTAREILDSSNYTNYCAKASHSHSYLPLSGGNISGPVSVSEKSAYNWVRFNNSWVGFYGSHVDAVNNTNRLAWMGFNDTDRFHIVNHQSGSIIYLQGGSNSVGYDGKSYSGMSAGTFYPKQAGVGLGYPATANRWTAVYASNGTIQTSDRNHKKNIEVLNDKYVQLFNKLKPVSFMFTRKGADRTHLGYIAQDVKEAMESVGLSELDFAGYCRDKESVFSDDTDTFIDVLDELGNGCRY